MTEPRTYLDIPLGDVSEINPFLLHSTTPDHSLANLKLCLGIFAHLVSIRRGKGEVTAIVGVLLDEVYRPDVGVDIFGEMV